MNWNWNWWETLACELTWVFRGWKCGWSLVTASSRRTSLTWIFWRLNGLDSILTMDGAFEITERAWISCHSQDGTLPTCWARDPAEIRAAIGFPQSSIDSQQFNRIPNPCIDHKIWLDPVDDLAHSQGEQGSAYGNSRTKNPSTPPLLASKDVAFVPGWSPDWKDKLHHSLDPVPQLHLHVKGKGKQKWWSSWVSACLVQMAVQIPIPFLLGACYASMHGVNIGRGFRPMPMGSLSSEQVLAVRNILTSPPRCPLLLYSRVGFEMPRFSTSATVWKGSESATRYPKRDRACCQIMYVEVEARSEDGAKYEEGDTRRRKISDGVNIFGNHEITRLIYGEI